MKIRPLGKLVLFILAAGVAFGAYRMWDRIAPGATGSGTVQPGKIDLPEMGVSGGGSGTNVALPGTGSGCSDKPEVRMLGYAWNAQLGILLANGGAQATNGSLMCKHGINFKWSRQDDNSKLTEALITFATELSRGSSNPSKGVHFVTIMGDGGAAFLKGLNDSLRKIGPEYMAKIVGTAGYSRGEDKFMGPAEWKANPAASRGAFCAGVLRDGDWNIAQKWLGDNGLRTNTDEKTYDPDALNWVNANDYIDAAQKYVTGYSEDRPVVRNGKRTGEVKHISVNSCVTWTPGDVTVAQKKGGLVSIVSTKEYSSQMPCVIIGINKWMKSHSDLVQGMLLAIGEAGDQIKSSPNALKKATQVAADLFHESGAGPDYWEKYFRGTTERDATGQTVELGGSSVNNIADSLLSLGLVPGSANLVAATYTVFGDVVKKQYPNLVPSYYPADQIVDTSYMQQISQSNAPTQVAVTQAKPKFPESAPVTKVVSKRSWHIHFQTGRAAFSPDAARELEKLRRDLLVASGTAVEVHGHTDNVGNADSNMKLSEQRAFAVSRWLEKSFPVNFPRGRVRVFAHGQTNPIAPNDSESGRSENRRVDVVMGTTG